MPGFADVRGRIVELRSALAASALHEWSDDRRLPLVGVGDRLVEDLRCVPFGAEVPT